MKHLTTMQDLNAFLESAERHADAWEHRETSTKEGEAEAYFHLAHAVGALDRLASAAEALRAPLAEALVAHQTDNADTLNSVWAEGVGDRTYGFDPEGGRKTATLLRRLDTEFGDVRLYRLSEPLDGYLYVTVSAVDHGGRPETFIFGADADGNRVSSELPGSLPGALDHAAALESAGYAMTGGVR